MSELIVDRGKFDQRMDEEEEKRKTASYADVFEAFNYLEKHRIREIMEVKSRFYLEHSNRCNV
jgi:hypothetical protein